LQETTYKCSVCSIVEKEEDIKVINLNFCDKCGIQLTEKSIQYKQTDKAIEFIFTCECGNVKVERSILLTDKELKIIKYEEIMSENTWEKVEQTYRDIAKELKYNWRWAGHQVNRLKETGLTPKEILDTIEKNAMNGYKLSSNSYIGAKKDSAENWLYKDKVKENTYLIADSIETDMSWEVSIYIDFIPFKSCLVSIFDGQNDYDLELQFNILNKDKELNMTKEELIDYIMKVRNKNDDFKFYDEYH